MCWGGGGGGGGGRSLSGNILGMQVRDAAIH